MEEAMDLGPSRLQNDWNVVRKLQKRDTLLFAAFASVYAYFSASL